MRPTYLIAVFLAFLVTAPLVQAKEKAEKKPTPRSHADDVVEAALERFDSEFKSKDMDQRIRILRWLGQHRHKDVLKKLKRIVITEPDAELQAVAAEGLGHQISVAKDATKVVKDALVKFKKYGSRETTDTPELEARNNDEARTLVNLFHSLTALYPYEPRRHKNDGWKDLKKFIDHNSDDVTIAMFEYVGHTKEWRAMPMILEWFNFYPDGYSWAGASAKVDTGAAGNKDQNAAKAKALGKAGGRRKKVRPAAWAAMSETVKTLTGKEMTKPSELKDWMDENKLMLKKHGV